jgi:catechol 2,3-dioxygenase-like lactoylglutathione lyase family enzyme
MKPPLIGCDRIHPELYVPDVPAAVDFYRDKLGFTVGFLWGEPEPVMSGVNLGEVQMFLCKGKPAPAGASVYFAVSNADDLYEFHKSNGLTIVEEIADREYGLRDYAVLDLNGYRLGFGHNIFNQGEPIYIERVDVPVRLEKRLAALLVDLAAHKRMSLSSTLEEILLHTSDMLPAGGVPSPHTQATLHYIQELKKKHGIDYDSHGSYRFVEKET